MKLELTGYKNSRRIVDANGDIVAMILQMTNGLYKVFDPNESVELIAGSYESIVKAFNAFKRECKEAYGE